jgi:uncharacterized RDD family membrane protein YckC
MSSEGQAWLTATVQRVMARHHLGEAERAGVHYELMSHLHAAGEGKAMEAGRDEVSLGDLQAAMLEMGGEEAMAQAFVAPRSKPVPRGGVVMRTAAVVVDYIIILLAEMALGFFVFLTGLFLWPFTGFRTGPWDWFDGPPGASWFLPLTVLLTLGYFAYFEGTNGRTFGKQVFNLRVQRTNGAPITMQEALVRNLVKAFPPFLLLDTLFLLVFFPQEKQRVSDRIADTVVVEGS